MADYSILPTVSLHRPINTIAGIGPAYAEKLEKLGIHTVFDLISHYPARYENYSDIQKIATAPLNEKITIVGTLVEIGNVFTKSRWTLTRGILQDDTGLLEIVWFNQPYLTRSLKAGTSISVSGKIQLKGKKKSIGSPAYEVLDGGKDLLNTGRQVPVYPETAGLSSRWLRAKVAVLLPQVKDQLVDWLPGALKDSLGLLPLAQAIEKVHFPENDDDITQSRRRLAYEELLRVHLSALKRKHEWASGGEGTPFAIDQKKLQMFTKKLPFALTNAQQRVVQEILSDLSRPAPMNRLLEGDVGSGKTVVAAIAMYLAHLNGFQSALMAPTEILANQHYATLSTILEPLGLTISLLTGRKNLKVSDQGQGVRSKEKGDDKLVLNSDVVVGTHALLTDRVQFKNLALAIIDEQHKFGVQQRAILRQKGNTPHVLTMTATPIPRTLALTLYGNLDLSVIDELPVGRVPPKTFVVPTEKRADAYKFIEKEITEKQVQAFIVCPLIEESETFMTAKAAAVEYERLTRVIYPHLRLGLLHGRMKPKEKDEVMAAFANKELDILVATPLVEVGIDIQNATIMMIEAADRFGLAQLHQLRGRVGRRAGQTSYCLLFTELKDPSAVRRLKAMETIYDGLKLAELDLTMRGAGEIFGTMQHGRLDFKIAKLSNLKLIEETRGVAQQIFDQYYLKGDSAIQQIIEDFDRRLVEAN